MKVSARMPRISAAAAVALARSVVARGAAWIVILNVGAFLMFGYFESNFLSRAALTTILASAGAIVILTVGQSLVLGVGQLDISIGANVVLSSVVGAKAMVAFSERSETFGGAAAYDQPGLAIVVGLIAAIAAGMLFGAVNGVLVAYFDVSALVATLGTFGIGTGLAFVITNGTNIFSIPRVLTSDFGNGRLLDTIPYHALIALGVAVVAWMVVNRTRVGLRLLAIGSNPSAADRAAIRRRLYVVAVFVAMGMLCGIAGFIDLARFNTTNIEGHRTDALSSIAGAVIGGSSLYGGQVSVTGAVFGGLFAVVLTVGFIVLGIPSFYNLIAVGVVLIVAVVIDSWRRRAVESAGD